MTRVLVAVACLAGVYALALGSADPVDLALGALLSGALLTALRGTLFPPSSAAPVPLLPRALALAPFLVAVVRDIVVGTWQVALVVLHVRPLRAPGIVRVPIGDRTPSGVVATSFIATLSPGEFLVDVDWERGDILMHVLDASDPDAVRARHDEFYRRYQRAVFP